MSWAIARREIVSELQNLGRCSLSSSFRHGHSGVFDASRFHCSSRIVGSRPANHIEHGRGEFLSHDTGIGVATNKGTQSAV